MVWLLTFTSLMFTYQSKHTFTFILNYVSVFYFYDVFNFQWQMSFNILGVVLSKWIKYSFTLWVSCTAKLFFSSSWLVSIINRKPENKMKAAKTQTCSADVNAHEDDVTSAVWSSACEWGCVRRQVMTPQFWGGSCVSVCLCGSWCSCTSSQRQEAHPLFVLGGWGLQP